MHYTASLKASYYYYYLEKLHFKPYGLSRWQTKHYNFKNNKLNHIISKI